MTVTIELRHDLDTHLRQLAEEQGMEMEEFLAELIEKAVPAMGSRAGVELLAAWDREDATQDPEELEERQLEWDAMKKAMNESHSSDRILFP
jgi:glutamate synthase domain-containing protein 3